MFRAAGNPATPVFHVYSIIHIPYADNPKKEVGFYAVNFIPNNPPPPPPAPKTDNIKAMCDAHRLSPDQEKQFCAGGNGDAPDEFKKTVLQNTEAGQSSPAAAAQLAQDGLMKTPEGMAQLVLEGRASRTAIVTIPAGAEIYVDGNKGGVTPTVFVLLKRDNPRVVTIKLPVYKTVEKTLSPDGKPIPLGIPLEKEQ